MEMQRETIGLEEVGFVINTVAAAEGVVTPPVNLPPVFKVLNVDGRANASASASPGRVAVEGTVALNVLYLSEKGEMYGFESIAVFRHNVDEGQADADMTLIISSQVDDIRSAVTTGGVNVRAQIALKCVGMRHTQTPIATDSGELECKKANIPLSTLEHVSNEIELREELSLPGSAQTLLSTEGFARVENIRTDPGRSLVGGTVRLVMTYVTLDGGVEQTTAMLPFECAFSKNFDKAIAGVQLQNLNSGLADNDSMFVEALLCVNLYGENICEREVLLDAYSTKAKMVATNAALHSNKLEPVAKRESCRVELPVPESMPQPMKVLEATVRASGMLEGGMAKIKLYTGVVYACMDDNIHSVNGVLETETALESDGETLIDIVADGVKAQLSGGDIAISCTLDIAGFTLKSMNYGVVDDMVPAETFEADGPVIYFTSPGESMWDIGKKFCVSMDALIKYNPEATEDNVGERMLINP